MAAKVKVTKTFSGGDVLIDGLLSTVINSLFSNWKDDRLTFVFSLAFA